MLGGLEQPMLHQIADVDSREEALAIANSESALAEEAALIELMQAMDDESVHSSAGLVISEHHINSEPDNNSINVRVIRPDTDAVLPCILYLHGGAMMSMSYDLGTYRAWGKVLAQQGICVAMVDFRNSLRPSTTEEVAPFPAGLNDCVSGYHWVRTNASALKIDPESVLIAGDSGGGNLAIATTMRLVDAGQPPLGLYALCPYILGQWPNADYPSSEEFEGYLISVHNNHATMAYGIEAFERRDRYAWPGFATAENLQGFPPSMISVNECDPLRDEGIAFYRKLLEAGVQAHCRQLMGTVHANEMFTTVFPELTRMTARDMVGWVRECQLLTGSAPA
nr:esterase [uncultured bacterium]